MLKDKLLKFGAGALMLTTMGMTAVPALAESTAVNIEIEATQIAYSVPASISATMNADGTNTLPTNYTIVNETPNVAIDVQSFEMTGNTVGEKTYTLSDDVADIKSVVDNTKMKFDMAFGTDTKDSLTDGYTVSDGTILEGESKTATFELTRSAQSATETVTGAFSITPTVNYAR